MGWSAEAVANGGRFPRRECDADPGTEAHGYKTGRETASAECRKCGARVYLAEPDTDLLERFDASMGDDPAWMRGYHQAIRQFRADLLGWEYDTAVEARLRAEGVRL